MPIERFGVPVGTPYSPGDVVYVRDDNASPPWEGEYVMTHTHKGIRVGSDRRQEKQLSGKCTNISTILPQEHWSDAACALVAQLRLEGEL